MKKTQPRIAAPCRNLLSIAVASCFIAELALANPTGPTVASGSASFSTVGSTLTVTNSPNAIINWRGFSIGANEATRFAQQSASSAVLNRVVGQDPSAILGTLSSNGKVFLINPNGILFGQGSRIDVAGLVASTLNITDADFLGKRLNFQAGAVANSIVNQGELHSATGGHIYLISPDVTNSGLISSPKGEVILAAGKSVSLVDINTPNLKVEVTAPDSTARNLGQIVADSGRIGVYAGLINQQGIVRADSASVDAATGRIVFRATDSATLGTGSVISASGANGAGGGTIEVLAKNSLNVAGRLDASAPNGGNGGFIETSAAHVHIDPATRVTTNAPYGKTGTWLIDPPDFNIALVGDITGAALSTNLGGTNVVITSDQGGSGTLGDVNVNDTVSWASGNSLTLIARNNVNVNSPVTNAGPGSILLYAGWDGGSTVSPTVTAGVGDIFVRQNLQTGGNLSLTAGRDIFMSPNGSDLTVSAAGNITISGRHLSISGGSNEKVTVSAGILFDAQLTGDFSLTGGSGEGSYISGTVDRSASLLANSVNVNAAGNLTVAGGEALARAILGLTANANADASIAATTSISLTGADVTIRGGDDVAARAAQSGAVANIGINSATSSASATLAAGTNITLSGTNITVRGGDRAVAEATRNGWGVIGTNTGAATTSANANLNSTGGNISLTGTASVLVRAGNNGLAAAHSNGETNITPGAGTGTSLLNANVSLSATNISLNAPSVDVRGGDRSSFVGVHGANFNGAGSDPGGNGTGSATANTDATLTATNDISVTGGSLTIRGGNFVAGSATHNGGNNGANVGQGAYTANARALLSATRDVTVTASGSVSVAGGAGASAGACCNGAAGGQGTGNATVDTSAEVTAGRDIAITATSLTIAGGDNALAYAGSNGINGAALATGQATVTARAKLLATRDITLNVSGPIVIRGGDNASAGGGRANGSDGVAGEGTSTVDAGAQVAATANLTILNATSLTVRGGDAAEADACCNGQSLLGAQGSGVGVAAASTSAVLSAGQSMTITVTAGGGTVDIRGGNNAFASACCNARHSGAVAGSGTASIDSGTTVSAGAGLTLTANSLTVRGGDGNNAQADLNGANGGANGIGSATINASGTLSANQAMALNLGAGAMLVRGGNNANAGASNNTAGNGSATVNTNASVSASGAGMVINAGSLTVQGGVQGASFVALAAGTGVNTATTNANASLIASNGLTYTGGAVVVQGGTARSQGGASATGQANANALFAGPATMTVTGNFDLIGGSGLDTGAPGGSASATASVTGTTSITSSGAISVGATTGVVSGNATVTTSINATPSGSISLIADDINLGGSALNAGIGTVTLGTFSATRDLIVEPGPSATPGVLSLTSTELSGVTAGAIVLSAGRDFFLNAGLGSPGTPLDRNVELRAGNNLQVTTNSIFLADNRNLTVVADNDLSGSGNLNIGGVTVQVGTTAANAGSMTLQGQNINAIVSGGGTGNVLVTGSGNQRITAAGDAVFQNNNATSGALTVQADGGTQSITANGFLVVAGSGTGTSTDIRAGGIQDVSVGANGLVITGGSGAATGSSAQIVKVGTSGTQTITVDGGNVIITGGSGSGTNNFAGINAGGTAQTINFLSGGDLMLTGGTVGTLNTAQITAANPTIGAQTQTISGANAISLTGGASGGGVDGSNNVLGNFARINNQNGSQDISVGAGGITLIGGSGLLTGNFALIAQGAGTGAPGTSQTLTINNGGAVSLNGGSTAQTNVINNPSNFFRGSYAMIQANGDSQDIDFTSGGALNLFGGSVGSNNPAQILSRFGLQTISGAPSITLQGGTGGYVDVATNKNEGNFARINGDAGQSIVASTITLTGGASGVGNHAQIFSNSTSVAQSISATSISLTGGAGGGIDSGSTGQAMGNYALIQTGAAQTIGTVDLSLTGGAGGTENFAAVIAPTQTISVSGDLFLVGGGSAAGAVRGGGARIGGNGGNNPTATNLTLLVGGDLTMSGGSALHAGSAIGSGILGAQTTAMEIDVGGNITLNPGTVEEARIGSPAVGLAGGDISITAGGTLALNGTSPGVGTAIRTLGNLTLNAASITQGSSAVIIAGGTTTVLASSASLGSATNDFTGAVNFNGTSLTISDANALTLGAVTASSLTATAASIGQNSVGIVAGTANLSAGSIALTTATNDFGTVNVTSGGNVAITDANAISVGTASVGGTFDLVATSTSFLNGFSANNYSFSGGSYTLAAGTYNLGGTTTVASSATVTASGASVNAAGGVIDVAGIFNASGGTVTAGTMNVSGTFNSSGGTVSVGTLSLLAGGTLSGTGTIQGNVNNIAGTVSPGFSPGILTIQGNYTQGPLGVLDMQVGAPAAGTPVAGTDYDQLKIIGLASLGGTLNTTLIGTAPALGTTFTLVDATGGISGTFTTVNQPAGVLFNTFYGPTTVQFIAGTSAGGGGGIVTPPGAIPPAAAEPFNQVVMTTQPLTEPVIELIETIVVAVVPPTTTTTPDGQIVPKPPACN